MMRLLAKPSLIYTRETGFSRKAVKLPFPAAPDRFIRVSYGLHRELQKIREFGGCCDTHRKRGMTATAVPVLLPGDEVIGFLGCCSPIRDTDYIRRKGIFQLLQEFAAQIGKTLTEAE